MRPLDLGLAVAVMAVWGSNFSVIAIGLEHWPPLLFSALRFALAFALLALWIRPPAQWKATILYGLCIGAGQFGLLFLAIDGWISPGLASLLVQTQVFFTIVLVSVLNAEAVPWRRLWGLWLAAAGVVLIALNRGGDASTLGLVLVLLAGLSWAAGNLVGRRVQGSMLSLIVWSSAASVPPLLALSLLFENPGTELFYSAPLSAWASLGWQAVGNTLFGYSIWAWLQGRYRAEVITPLALLVPVFGLLTAALWLGEAMPLWKLTASGLVLAGLGINMLLTRQSTAKTATTTTTTASKTPS